MESVKTKGGTELGLLNLQGKKYLPVAERVRWFIEERPDWAYETSLVEHSADAATVRAVIKDESGRIRATGHKSESRQGFGDFVEKAETGAIGRALALLGYGTQFAMELDEGSRIVDSPRESKPLSMIDTVNSPPAPKAKKTEAYLDAGVPFCGHCKKQLRPSKNGKGYYCPSWLQEKDAPHSYLSQEQRDLLVEQSLSGGGSGASDENDVPFFS